jgi:HAD superfamily hydrolase (TIGR01549 family)
MKYDAVIFDLDGTLIHTKPEYRYNLVGKVLKQFGSSAEKEDIDLFWFETDRNDIIINRFKRIPETFWEEYIKLDTPAFRKPYVKIYDDILYILDLKNKNYKTGIVTGAPKIIADFEIDLIGRYFFDSIIVARSANGFKPKPDPECLLTCIRNCGIEKEKVIYVGNGEEDILTARNADVKSVYIDRNEHNGFNIMPDYKIKTLYELDMILNGRIRGNRLFK